MGQSCWKWIPFLVAWTFLQTLVHIFCSTLLIGSQTKLWEKISSCGRQSNTSYYTRICCNKSIDPHKCHSPATPFKIYVILHNFFNNKVQHFPPFEPLWILKTVLKIEVRSSYFSLSVNSVRVFKVVDEPPFRFVHIHLIDKCHSWERKLWLTTVELECCTESWWRSKYHLCHSESKIVVRKYYRVIFKLFN